jgi:alkanesulfonate monooxygenase SsuD/methylene tetrahydromethanopterin reductase-like flavin-dependent oxidoreductase (luciferase family)
MNDVTRFRFGVTNAAVGSLSAWTSAAQRAESLGYSTFLLPDTTATPAPLPALAAAAAATTSLEVGTWVICEPLRERGLLLWEAATMAALLGDRFELGIGAGRPAAERDAAVVGRAFPDAATRLRSLGETVALLRERLPGTRILVAGSGPRLLRLAAQVADTVALGWPPATDIPAAQQKILAVREAAQGREVELAAGLIAVGDMDPPWLRRMGATAADLVTAGAVTVVTGSARQMADAIQRRRDALGISYVTVPSEAAEAFAPVVDLLTTR